MNDETRKRLGEAIKAGDDPYVYPGTHVLRNKLGITDLSAWSKQEADFCWHRILEYQAIPRGPGADPPRLKTIHRLIFRDCYEWAGKFRTIDIAKGADSFLPPNSLESNATRIFGHLAQENHLKSWASINSSNAYQPISPPSTICIHSERATAVRKKSSSRN